MPTHKERKAHLALWSAEFGHRNRHTIQTVEIDAVLSKWLEAGEAVVHRQEPQDGPPGVLDGLRREAGAQTLSAKR